MEKKDLRIVYMGTPEFAVESLKRLVEGGYNVVAVITMPDKPMGRHGSVLQASPVKQYAVSQGLSGMVMTATTLYPPSTNRFKLSTANSGVPIYTILKSFFSICYF